MPDIQISIKESHQDKMMHEVMMKKMDMLERSLSEKINRPMMMPSPSVIVNVDRDKETPLMIKAIMDKVSRINNSPNVINRIVSSKPDNSFVNRIIKPFNDKLDLLLRKRPGNGTSSVSSKLDVLIDSLNNLNRMKSRDLRPSPS